MKTRMDKAGDRANWSGIAQRAFGFELNHLEAVKEIKSMTDVIERLKQSKAAHINAELSDGRSAGVEWAKGFAEYGQLFVLAQVAEDIDDHGLEIFLPNGGTGAELLAGIYEYVLAEDEAVNAFDVSEYFGLSEAALKQVSVEWVQAFIGGAMDVWSEEERQI